MNYVIAIKKKSKDKVFAYLNKYSNNFTPPLNERVDLLSFSLKIFNHATQFWLTYKSEPIGFAACYFNNPDKKFGYITTISVVDSWQGFGLGVKILKKILSFASLNEFEEVRLEVYNTNKKALKFYLKNGFNVIETRTNSMILSCIV